MERVISSEIHIANFVNGLEIPPRRSYSNLDRWTIVRRFGPLADGCYKNFGMVVIEIFRGYSSNPHRNLNHLKFDFLDSCNSGFCLKVSSSIAERSAEPRARGGFDYVELKCEASFEPARQTIGCATVDKQRPHPPQNSPYSKSKILS